MSASFRMWFASGNRLYKDTIEIAEITANTAPSLLCQNFGAINGMNAKDSNTTANGSDSMMISAKLTSLIRLRYLGFYYIPSAIQNGGAL